MSAIASMPFFSVKTTDSIPSKTYYMDFNNKVIIGKVEGYDALPQLIQKILYTERFAHLIYDNQYGSEIKKAVYAQGVSGSFIKSKLEKIVSDALMSDVRILNVRDFSYKISGDEISISLLVESIYGSTGMEIII